MRTIQVNTKSLNKEFVDIRENLIYIRTILDEIKERAREDRNITLAHIKDDEEQFYAINQRLNRWVGAIGVLIFLATTGLAAAGLLLP